MKPWLVSVLVGPWTTIVVGVTVSVLVGYWDPLLGPWMYWTLAMLSGTGCALVLTVSFATMDLLRARSGTPLPVGAVAWMTVLLSPVVPWLSWMAFPPAQAQTAVIFVFLLITPNVVAALALRLALHRGRSRNRDSRR